MTFSSNGSTAAFPLLVRLEGVNVTLQGAAALKNIYLDIRQGDHLALLGPNGAGKSTLLRVLRGETRPDQRQGGSVRWFPLDCGPDCGPGCEANSDDAPLAGRGMTSLISPGLQEHYMRQAWNIRGEELVIAGLYDDYLLYRDPTQEQRAQCFALAEKLQTAALLEKSVGTLSQGQLRVLLLMRALIRRPRLLLLDEATDGLDAPTRCMFVILLESLVNQPDSPTIVMTTHRPQLPDFLKLAARMENGELSGPAPLPTACGEKNESLASASTPSNIPGFAVNPASCVAEQKARQANKREAEPDRNSAAPQTDREGAHVLLRNATVFVDRAEVLHELDWEILPGEQWTVLGGNGAGKTTLLRVLMGEEPVAVGGDINRNLPRHGGLNPDLSHIQRGIRLVSDRLQALYTYNERASDVVFSGLDGCVGVYREAEEAERAEALRCLRLVGMEAWAERPFRSLSTGQARRVLLARALAGNPEMLLLDEPFSGLDRESRATMTEILESRIADGLQTVLVSHHEEDILPSCTHLARLDNGRLISAMPLPKP